MNEHITPAPYLTLVRPDCTFPRVNPVAMPQPVPTQEFLSRRVLALTIGTETVGAMLSEAASYLQPDAPDSRGRYSSISDALRLAGIWVWPPESEDDPPTHGLVVYPEKLVKRFPDLKRLQSELEGLKLELSPA
jgi:hypothetical protein